MEPQEQVKFFKALADASRLRIVASLMESPKYVELLAERLELSASTVSFHLKKLEEVGLVTKVKDQYYIIYSLEREMLNRPLSDWLSASVKANTEEDEREAAYRQKVIETFFKFGKLKSIPVQRKKRLIILEKLVLEFQEGKSYSEKEVNAIIGKFHEDFATLRRELINEKLMARENGIYQRII